MTTAQFLGAWIVLLIAGLAVNAKELKGKGGGVPGNTILMVVLAALATGFIWCLGLLS